MQFPTHHETMTDVHNVAEVPLHQDTFNLVAKLPPCWHGLFGAMRPNASDPKPQEMMDIWYKTEVNSKYGAKLNWGDLLLALTAEEPVNMENDLQFVCRFCLLPNDIQDNFLSFLLRNVDSVCREPLLNFLRKTSQHCKEGCWNSLMLNSLLELVEKKPPSYIFSSEETRLRVDKFCKSNFHTTKTIWNMPFKYSEHFNSFKSEAMDIDIDERIHFDSPRSQLLSVNSQKNDEMSSLIGNSQQDDRGVVPTNRDNDAQTPIKRSPFDTVIDRDVDSSPQLSQSFSLSGILSCSQNMSMTQEPIEVIEAKVSQLLDAWQSDEPSDPDSVSDLVQFLSLPSKQIKRICEELGLGSLTEGGVVRACEQVGAIDDCSMVPQEGVTVFLAQVLQPKIQGLETRASRQLSTVISLVSEKFFKSMVDGVFVSSVESLGSPQSDVMCRVIKDTASAYNSIYLLERLLESPICLNDQLIAVFQSFLDLKNDLENDLLMKLAQKLTKTSAGHEKNIKYGKLLLAFLNRYGGEMNPETFEILLCEVNKHQSFLRKTLTTAIHKLKPPS